MVHIFHFLQSDMVLGVVNPFSRKTNAISSGNSCLISMPFLLNTERSYKWRLSGSAGQSEIGILRFDWLIHPGVSYSREICNFSGEFVIFQSTAEGKIFRLFAFFLKRSAKTTRMTSTEHEFRHLHLIYMHFNLLFSLFHLCKHIDCFRVVYSM